MREGDNLFCASIVALNAKTGEHVWHFQEVHHDIWDYDAASPVVLFDTVINGQPRKGIAEAGRTGWVYILDRTNGKPLIGIEERPVPQEPRQKTAKTQPYPIGDATCRNAPSRWRATKGRLHLRGVLGRADADPAVGATAARTGRRCRTTPIPGISTCPGTIRTSVFCALRRANTRTGSDITSGTQAAPIGSPMSGTFTAIDSNTNKIAWQHKMPVSHGRRRRLDRDRRRPRVAR